jgi:hypothetical protein
MNQSQMKIWKLFQTLNNLSYIEIEKVESFYICKYLIFCYSHYE